MFLRTIQSFALIFLAFLLVACGGESDPLPTVAPGAGDTNTTQSDTSADNTTADAGVPADRGLAAGEYSLNIAGAVTSGESYSHERRSPAEFDPFGSGTNAEGPYNITLRLDGTYNDTPVYIEVNLITNGILAPGQYTLANTLGNDENARAYVEIEDPEGEFAASELADFRDPQGTLTIDAMNLESVSGAVQFTATDEDSGESITVDAAFTEIPFEPDREIDVTYGGIYEGYEHRTTNIIRPASNVTITFVSSELLVYLDFPNDIAPGTYDINTENSPVTVDPEEATGTITFDRADTYFNASFDLTVADDEGEGTVSGSFAYIENSQDE